MKKLTVLLVAAFAGFIALLSSAFVINETEQALVLQFGQARRIIQEPGLHFKIPLVQDVIYYDNRVLEFNDEPNELILADQKRLVVDTMSLFRIVDPRRFYTSVQTEANARRQLTNIVRSKTREVLGNSSLQDLLVNNATGAEIVISERRQQVMEQIRSTVNVESEKLGISMVDVRIRRADLPLATSNAILARMMSEREREAREFRAQGEEIAQEIRARADRERTVMLSEAEREAQVIRGQGDAEALKVYADAFGQDPEFFAFYRSMEAYRKSFGDGSETFVLSPDGEFFRYFNSTRTAQ